MSGPVVELRGVTKTYPGPPPVTAVDDVTLTIAAGSLTAIVGPSGSGKTTLLHVMGALDTPTSGEVRIGGDDVSGMSDRELAGLRAWRLGFVFQEYFLLGGVTAVDNVAQGLVYRATSPAERRRRAMEALERVGLSARADHEPGRLSGGERQRVAIARALVGDPAVVFADEPTGNLDSTTSAGIVQLLLDLHGQGSTIVVITHDPGLAGSMPTRLTMLDGKVRT